MVNDSGCVASAVLESGSESSNQEFVGSGIDLPETPKSDVKTRRNHHAYHIEKNEDEYHHSKLGMHAYLLWKNNKVTDVTIKFKGQTYDAHRPVLSCYSTHFKERILSSDKSQHVIVLEAPSITTDAFETLLYYMYTGHLELTCQNIGDVYTASRKLGIKTALSQCMDTFIGKRNPEVQPVYLYATAKKLNETATAQRSLLTMARHFEQIVGTKEFLDLNTEEVTEYLSCDELAVRSEIIVYLAALKWLNVRFLERERHVEEVIKCVRFPMMTLNEILACHSPPLLPGIVEMPVVQYILLKATCYVASKTVNEQKRFEKFSCKPRTYLIRKVPLLLWDPNIFDPDRYAQYKREMAATIIQAGYRGYLTRQLVKEMKIQQEKELRYHSKRQDLNLESPSDSGTSSSTLPSTSSKAPKANDVRRDSASSRLDLYKKPSSATSSATVGKEFKITKESDFSDSMNRHVSDKFKTSGLLKMMTDLSNKLPTLINTAETNLGYASSETGSDYDNKQSGEDSGMSLFKRLNLFDKKEDRLQKGSLEGLSNHDQQFSISGIIVLGGLDRRDLKYNAISNSMLRYCPALDRWFDFGTMPINRHHLCVVLHHTAIYVIGGCDPRNTTDVGMTPSYKCFRLELSNMTWTQIADMNYCRMFHGVAVVQDKIYVVGGLNDENKILSSIECYDAENDNWDVLTVHMSCPKMSVGVCGHNDELWLAGGMIQDESNNLCIIKEVERYNPTDNVMLHDIADLPGPRSYLTLVECNGILYSIGGGALLNSQDEKISSLAEVYFYDDNTNLWVCSTPLPNPQHSVTAAVFGGAIFVLGGISTYFPDDITTDVIVYEPDKDIWAKCKSLPTAREGACAVSITSKVLDELSEKVKEENKQSKKTIVHCISTQ